MCYYVIFSIEESDLECTVNVNIGSHPPYLYFPWPRGFLSPLTTHDLCYFCTFPGSWLAFPTASLHFLHIHVPILLCVLLDWHFVVCWMTNQGIITVTCRPACHTTWEQSAGIHILGTDCISAILPNMGHFRVSINFSYFIL